MGKQHCWHCSVGLRCEDSRKDFLCATTKLAVDTAMLSSCITARIRKASPRKNVGALTCLDINGFLDPYLYQSHRCKPLIYWPFSASSALIGWTPKQSLHLLDLLYWWRSLINAAHQQQIRRDLKPLPSSNNQALEERIVQQPFLSEFVTATQSVYCLFFNSLSV